MNHIMSIRRSSEEGKYLLREDDCLWRVDEDGEVDCSASGHATMIELLNFLQTWKTPSRRLIQRYPEQGISNE